MNAIEQHAKVLIIDDDLELGQMIGDFLALENIDLSARASGEDGLAALGEQVFDLLILDIMLPGMSGIDVLKKLRQTSDMPVIMLTARGDAVDRIVGLEVGADDYLAKPFNPRELLARIKAILRRAQPRVQRQQQLRVGSISTDATSRTAMVHDVVLKLTGTEYEILRSLMETPGMVVTKEQLSETVLGRRLLPYDRSVDTHISNLRSKLESAGSSGETIRNQRGVGYLLVPGRGDDS